MGKSSNINQKSTKAMLIIYRLFLKLAFAFLILAGFVVLQEKGADFENGVFIFAITSAIIFAVSYAITYYLYKYYNKNKFERAKKDPLKMQIVLMLRLVLFIIGAVAFIGGMAFAFVHFTGILIAILGLVLCEFLFYNRRLTSHLSTFSENVAAGVLFSYIYLCAITEFNYIVCVFYVITLLLLFAQEFFYHLTNISKHDTEGLKRSEMVQVRAKYFIRNALIYTLLYAFAGLFAVCGLYDKISSSSIATIIFQLLPLIISIITVVVLLYTTFHKSDQTANLPDYNTVFSAEEFKRKLAPLNSASTMRAYDYVVGTMTCKNGYCRKDGEDYYFHCLNVANILLDAGKYDENIMSTALLHDCVEDIEGCSTKDIERMTNASVAHSVDLLTKKKDINYKNDDNMSLYLQNILGDRVATLVKIADRLHNMSTLSHYSEGEVAKKKEDTKRQFIPFITSAMDRYPMDNAFFEQALFYFKNM